MTDTSEFECLICHEIMEYPLRTSCPSRHTFCGHCIHAWFKNNFDCPVCKYYCGEAIPDRALKKRILKYLAEHPEEKERVGQDESQVLNSMKYEPWNPVSIKWSKLKKEDGAVDTGRRFRNPGDDIKMAFPRATERTIRNAGPRGQTGGSSGTRHEAKGNLWGAILHQDLGFKGDESVTEIDAIVLVAVMAELGINWNPKQGERGPDYIDAATAAELDESFRTTHTTWLRAILEHLGLVETSSGGSGSVAAAPTDMPRAELKNWTPCDYCTAEKEVVNLRDNLFNDYYYGKKFKCSNPLTEADGNSKPSSHSEEKKGHGQCSFCGANFPTLSGTVVTEHKCGLCSRTWCGNTQVCDADGADLKLFGNLFEWCDKKWLIEQFGEANVPHEAEEINRQFDTLNQRIVYEEFGRKILAWLMKKQGSSDDKVELLPGTGRVEPIMTLGCTDCQKKFVIQHWNKYIVELGH